RSSQLRQAPARKETNKTVDPHREQKKEQEMKQRWRISTALATSVFILAALGTAGIRAAASAAARTTTTLTLWQDGSVASSASYLPDLIASFEHSHPGVKIQVVAQPSSNYFALLQTSFISKTAPDIADLFAGTYLSWLVARL